MPEPRITISSNPITCLQRFELPLNGQTFNAIGIKGLICLLRLYAAAVCMFGSPIRLLELRYKLVTWSMAK